MNVKRPDIADDELLALMPTPAIAGELFGVQVIVTDHLPRSIIWTRPRPPSKAKGRKGTRRAWKRANPPALRPEGPPLGPYQYGRKIICSPDQLDALRAALKARAASASSKGPPQ